uniref:(northern house mosquito) hypothetical protein n=1 Tax=Culex pipiens TaxID=7175 RepID=A0A8D8GLR3_CULPI
MGRGRFFALDDAISPLPAGVIVNCLPLSTRLCCNMASTSLFTESPSWCDEVDEVPPLSVKIFMFDEPFSCDDNCCACSASVIPPPGLKLPVCKKTSRRRKKDLR